MAHTKHSVIYYNIVNCHDCIYLNIVGCGPTTMHSLADDLGQAYNVCNYEEDVVLRGGVGGSTQSG